ncbi:MAG: VCBS repeat-containing protein, partial [Planctomycetota bacterium]|nr:VCBS repeat-containing protein [Planctomycetota bacterium]
MKVNPRSKNHWARMYVPAMLCLMGLASCDKPPEKSVMDGHWKTSPKSQSKDPPSVASTQNGTFVPRKVLDGSGYGWVMNAVKPWPSDSSLEQIGEHFKVAVRSSIDALDHILSDPALSPDEIASSRYSRSTFLNYQGDPLKAYEDLCLARKYVETNPRIAKDFLYTIIYNQGVTAMRRGENENCIACRGESSCILPISKAAVHQNPEGSRIAIQHFMEYLEKFPEDGEVRWLLNVAYMTLDEHPEKVPSQYRIPMDRYVHQENGIGRFRDIGEKVGLNRLNQAGGAIMDDFDADGKLDVVISSFDPTQIMGVYRNVNLEAFEDVTVQAGVSNQLGGLNCVQTDYNNDGLLDVFIVRGAWL